MFVLLVKKFFRSAGTIAGLCFLLGAGIISLYTGRQHLLKQQDSIVKTAVYQHEHIRRHVPAHQEMGLLLYYLRFILVNKTDPLNGLSIGQRDINSSVQNLTIRNLENQRYDTDIINPTGLLSGNLDLGFVVIYLFPLLIIAFTFNLLSEEKESNTWRLVLVQSGNPLRILLQKFTVVAIAIYAVLFVLLAAAIPILSLPFNKALAGTAVLLALYLLVWFTISFAVASLHKSSSSNAVILSSAWILLTIVLPAGINNYISTRYPVPEALATVVKQREGYHEKWDMDKKSTMDQFYAHYPVFKKYALPDKDFSWLWYYAMQQMGDDDARQESAALKNKLWKREKISKQLSLFVPTLHTQLQLNDLTHAGLANQLRFLDSTARFHEKMRLYFYPKIFEETPVTSEKWDSFAPEFYTDTTAPGWAMLTLPLWLSAMVLGTLALVNFKRKVLI